jgi:hypothetical protein
METSDDGTRDRSFSLLWLGTDVTGTDFDGHTAFHLLTFTQKLTWVSEAVVSIYMMARDNPSAACNRFFERCLDR